MSPGHLMMYFKFQSAETATARSEGVNLSTHPNQQYARIAHEILSTCFQWGPLEGLVEDVEGSYSFSGCCVQVGERSANMMGEGDSDGTFWKQHHREHGPKTNAKKWTDKDNNPCVAEANASYKCLHETNFDRKSCQTYFVNYQNCQRFWLKISKERRKLGIKPPLPTAEERNKILQDIG
ncbi:uncharacterized protein LOC119728677 [Patiria miniata]|uniref:Coiled-coil-helix-coiled-coil-helix domain-containing protein 7 n=1 Tax=Patiria miniata TaxID=46514 RepID=A0A913ZZP3_PATMI|nr:uncharacterized protein LOC119728677 [Patiria miniata]